MNTRLNIFVTGATMAATALAALVVFTALDWRLFVLAWAVNGALISAVRISYHLAETKMCRPVWRSYDIVLKRPAQGIEAGTGETEGLDAKRESPVGEADAPQTPPVASSPNGLTQHSESADASSGNGEQAQ